MKKILTGLLSAGLLLSSAVPALAQDSPWKYARAYPGHPVTLEGQGEALAYGRGKIRYQVVEGMVRIAGRGVVAVKGNPEVKVHGFGGKIEKGEWTYYFGRGTLEAKGTDFEAVLWGRASTRAKGSGKATYRGFWKIRYHGFSLGVGHLEVIPLPEELKAQAGPDANLE